MSFALDPVWKQRGLALALGLAGGIVFTLAHAPLPWLLGPMFACLIAGLSGAKLAKLGLVVQVARSVLGVAIGVSLTPELAGRIGDMALSLALLPIYVIVIGVAGYPYFRHVCKFDPPTAFYSAMPGGLQDMLIFGEAAGANVRVLSLVHATRVLVIVSVLPFVLQALYGVSVRLGTSAVAPVEAIPASELAAMAACAAIGWLAAHRAGIPGASIVGPMILGTVASLGGLLHHRPPNEVILIVQVIIGVSVGATYSGVTWSEIRQVVLSVLGYTLLLAVLATIFAELAVLIAGVRPIDALLAFAPGGQGEMTLLAIAAHADVAFVALHHITRVFLVILLGPVVQRRAT